MLAYLNAEENGSRAGEFAIGTNIGINALCGIMLQDEKIPGLHVGLGYPYGDLTGAAWSCETHVDLVPSACTIFVDGNLLLKDGRFTLGV